MISTPSRGASPGLAYAPFGEGYATSSAWVQFTSAGNVWTQNDGGNNGTGTLDDFMYRRYNASSGRWISPDPAGLAAVDPTNPQSWYRYAYVMNNPLIYVDPTGLYYYDCVWSGGCSGLGSGAGVGAGDYGGGPGGCSLDGIQTACQNLTGLGSNGIQACPGPCTAVNGSGQIIQFHAFAGDLPGGYYAVMGPGALYYSANAAGTAAILLYGPYSTESDADGLRYEYGGTVYTDANGVYSYTGATVVGPGCEEFQNCSSATATWVPGGTQEVADWHTHPWESGPYQFGGPLPNGGWIGDVAGPNYYPTYVSTPIGNSYGVFLIGTGTHSPVCNLTGPTLGISSCH